nr:MAG TPA: hypothetical protein [Caudoviricetes sp.]
MHSSDVAVSCNFLFTMLARRLLVRVSALTA